MISLSLIVCKMWRKNGTMLCTKRHTSPNLIMRILKREDVERALPLKTAIEVNRKAFLLLSQGKATVPSRTIINVEKHNGDTFFKPAYVPAESALGLKVVSVRPNNSSKDLPNVPGFIVLVNEETALPEALMEATYLTALRTAAGSAAATEVLAKPTASVLTVFGAGMQARMHIEAICLVRPIRHIYIINRTKENSEKLIADLKKTVFADNLVHLEAVQSNPNIIAKSDIIVTATNSSTPLFDGHHLSPGTHINAIGSYKPTMQELDVHTIKKSLVYVDTEEAFNSGDLRIPLSENFVKKEDIYGGEIGQLFADIDSGHNTRSTSDRVTIFKSVGTAVQDIVTAQAALRLALSLNLGFQLDF